MMLRSTTAAAALACLLGATTAQAEPSLWTQAARPETKRLADALEEGDRYLNQDIQLRRTEPATSSRRVPLLHRARKALEGALDEHGKDPDLRFRLGEVYYELYGVDEDPKWLERATKHLSFVADTATAITVRAAALTDLAVCYAHLGRHAPEIEAYDRALAVQPHQDSRAILLANRAEGHMVQGDVISAVRGYRQSLKETPSIRVHLSGVTTLWGLAVALDRSGDLGGALEHIELARAYDPTDQNLSGPGWFYVPDYDESWYAALGHWSRARLAEDRDVRNEAYREAVAGWRRYINAAPLTDPWLPLASARLRQCERELQKALREAPRKGR